VVHDGTEDDGQARSASSAPALDTESTDISNDGTRQPKPEIDEAGSTRAEPAPQAPEGDQNGAGTRPPEANGSTTEPPALDGSNDEAAAPATTPEPATMTTTQTDGGSPSDNERDRAGDDAAADPTDAAATSAETGGSPEPAEATAPASADPAAKAGHDPVIDAVTTELPAVPASVRGLDDAPAGPPAPGDANGSTSPAAAYGPAAPPASSYGPAAPSSDDGGAGPSPSPAAPANDLAVTTEMPRIDAPAPPVAPAASNAGSDSAVYEVRAAGVKADPPAAPSSDPAEPEPPVTEQIPTVVERPSAVRDEPTTRVLGTDDRPRHFRVGPAKPINTGEVPQIEEEPKRRRRSRGTTVAVLAPVVVVMLLIVAWAADTASLSGQVLRNVEIAGRQIGGKGEEALPEIMADIAAEQADRKVTIEVQGDPAAAATTPTTAAVQQLAGRESGSTLITSYETTAAALGLVLDEDATTQAALDMGRGDTVFVRPLKWVKSFFTPREVPLEFTVTETQTAATLQLLQGADRTAPTDPSIQLTDGGFVMTPGREGEGIDVSQVASDLLDEAQANPDGAITIVASAAPVEPQFSDDEAQQLADRANGLTANGITLKADTVAVPVAAQQLRSWIKPTVVDNELDLAFDPEKATAELPALFADLDAEPTNASMTLEGNVPTVVPGANGVTCCGDNAADLIWDGIRQEKGEVALEAVVTEPEITTAEVESWGIKEPIGGNRGYQSGAEINGGVAPGFTTFHACCESRVTNIHKIADIVRGTVIPPDGTFSVNDTVGQRTAAKGFVAAGAIAEGKHVQEIGGGVSQFATTTFNAAYFAGLDIEESQSHSEWFTRYPPGREATMGYPAPDLVIHNNTPYGVMIWTSYTDTSLTVTMYSTTWATAQQSNISESMSGACRVVTTTRTRSYPDQPSETDTFRSTYRPGEGLTC
jgi:vancomycin resistance protein YoaR